MKKITCVLFFLSLMTVMLFLLPTKVDANDFNLYGCRLYIGGVEVTSNKRSGDGWTFEAATNTIVLKNFDIASLGSHIRNENKGHGTYRKMAIIYVDAPTGLSLDITIRSEGGNTNYIGDKHYSGKFFDYINGYATAFCGIFNPNGNVTITGSTDLRINTHLECISATTLTIDTNSWVYTDSYTCAIDVVHMNMKGNSRLSALAYCATSTTYGYNSTIHCSRSLNIYDKAVISSEIYRDEDCDNYAVSSIYSYTINARGGSILAKCYANGPKSSRGNGIDCLGILVSSLNVSNNAVVEAYVYNTSRKTYIGTVALGAVYPESAIIRIQGAGVIRTGIQMKRPSGDTETKEESLCNINNIQVDKYVNCAVSNQNYRPSGFENFDKYQERVASVGDGIYIRTNNGVQEWAYFRDFRKIQGSGKKTSINPSLPGLSLGGLLSDVGEILANNPSLPVYVLSGTVMLVPKSEDGNIQKIVVEGGTLNIRFSGGKKYHFTEPIEIKDNATITIDGDGIADGLNVTGTGKIKFNGGTVTGSVYMPVNMIVDGGNINVNYYNSNGSSTSAYNSNGQKVNRTTYTFSSDKVFTKINLIRMREREYGSVGMYPLDGRTTSVWTIVNDEVVSARATYLDNGEPKTISLYRSYAITDLVEGGNIQANYSSIHTVSVGTDLILHPMNIRNADISGFNLKWTYSDDGIEWMEVDESIIDGNGNVNLKNVPIEYNDRQYRCEIYSKYDDELLDTFYTEIYVYSSIMVCEDGFVDCKKATIRVVPNTLIPESLYYRAKWYVSKDGGNNFTYIGPSIASITDKDSYEFDVEDYMDGWIIKCESVPHTGRFEFPQFNVSSITINVTEKKIRIEEQPQGSTFENYNKFDYAELSVKARNVTSYQWQVSKRRYLNNNEPFENIQGANSPTYKIKMNSVERYMINYLYRCVLTNEYGEVITDAVNNTVYYKPLFSSVENNMSVGVDGKASVVINIDPGNPAVANTIVWMVSRDHAYTFEPLSDEIMNGVKYDISEVTMVDGVTKFQYTVFSMLEITNPTEDMNEWVFGAFLYVDGVEEFSTRLTLTILSECQAHGHDWLPATCTELSKCSREGCGATTGGLLPHTGGVATCIEKSKCEVCGNYYGELDHHNHAGTDKWNEEEWEYGEGHESTWSCCGEPKHPYEKHNYYEGICTVCNYICSHQIISEANCHERKHCHICNMDFATIEPDNHDLSLGTYVRDKKDATCEEDGYTGDVVCWNCMECITHGTVIKATGHDDSWPATCKDPAYCNICKKYFGDIDPNNHAEWSYFVKNETNHEKHWTCCDMVTIEDHDFDENNICKICLYGCKHSGGNANCMEPAICEKCGDPYGELDPNNHVGAIYYNHNETTHTGICGCGVELTTEEHHWEHGECTVCYRQCTHTGGTATCTEGATCTICGEKYGDLDYDNHWGTLVWNRTSTTHSKKWNCCGTISSLEEEHTIVDGVCTTCFYGCKHTGGTATCTEAATCTICGEKYGELDPSNHTHLNHVPLKQATVSEEGNIEYWYCSSCNKYYSDSKLTTEITKEDTIIAKIAEEKNNKSKIVIAITVPTVSALGIAGGIIFYIKKKRKPL